jgi:hypothetical protein
MQADVLAEPEPEAEITSIFDSDVPVVRRVHRKSCNMN